VIIDFHAHIGDFRMGDDDSHRVPVTWQNLIARLDEEGIDKAVVLPVYNASPDGAPPAMCVLDDRMSVRDQVIDAARYADRIIPFGNMDPRWLWNSPRSDFGPLLDWFIEHGCKGIGEVTAQLPYDDPRTINMFQQIGARHLLVTIESAGFAAGFYGLQDDPGLPRLERLIREAPQTIIIGHGPGFWCEISEGVTQADKWAYPGGPIIGQGAAWRLLRTYPNLYADLSAHSGFNAITRDLENGTRFLNDCYDKLLFGTDTCFGDAAGRTPHHGYLRRLLTEGKLSPPAFDCIMSGNAVRLLAAAGQ
jgi:uncharacterized protein